MRDADGDARDGLSRLDLDPLPAYGGGEIRTLGTPIRRSTVFETAAFNRSATPPGEHG